MPVTNEPINCEFKKYKRKCFGLFEYIMPRFLEGLRQTTVNFKITRYPDRISNRGPSAYGAGVIEFDHKARCFCNMS
jgi:hypothetical protein